MTIAVSITVEALEYTDGSKAEAILTEPNGKTRKTIHRFTKAAPTWDGHMWKERDLKLVEVIVPAPEPKG